MLDLCEVGLSSLTQMTTSVPIADHVGNQSACLPATQDEGWPQPSTKLEKQTSLRTWKAGLL